MVGARTLRVSTLFLYRNSPRGSVLWTIGCCRKRMRLGLGLGLSLVVLCSLCVGKADTSQEDTETRSRMSILRENKPKPQVTTDAKPKPQKIKIEFKSPQEIFGSLLREDLLTQVAVGLMLIMFFVKKFPQEGASLPLPLSLPLALPLPLSLPGSPG